MSGTQDQYQQVELSFADKLEAAVQNFSLGVAGISATQGQSEEAAKAVTNAERKLANAQSAATAVEQDLTAAKDAARSYRDQLVSLLKSWTV